MDARMILRGVVDENEPQYAPNHSEASLDVENRFPAKRGGQNTREREWNDCAQRHTCWSLIEFRWVNVKQMDSITPIRKLRTGVG